MRLKESKDAPLVGQWFLGPSVIGLGAMASKLGHKASWLSKARRAGQWHQDSEVISCDELQRADSLLRSRLSAKEISQYWEKHSFQESPTVWTLSAAAPSPLDILKLGSEMSLLDSNAYVFGVREYAGTLRVTIYPIVPLSTWQHVMLLQQLALGYPAMLGTQDAVASIHIEDQQLTVDQLIDFKPKPGSVSKASQVVFKADALSVENPFASSGWEIITRSIVSPMIAMRLKQQSASYRVVKALVDSYAGGLPLDMVAIADLLFLEKSTLRRRLKDESTAFSRLLSQFRCQEARLRLQIGDTPIDVAHALGYDSLVSLKRLLKSASCEAL